MHSELLNLKNTCSQVPTLADLSNEFDERIRRSHNVIISGVPESEGESSLDDDKTKCFEVLRAINCHKDSVTEVGGIGKPNKDRPRLLKEKCKSLPSKEVIINNVKRLRKFPKFRDIHINPDRTPVQQSVWKELFIELRNRRQQDEDAVIFHNRVVSRRLPKNL